MTDPTTGQAPPPASVAPRKTIMQRVGYRLFAVAIALDIFVSALTGGNAYSTVSARVGSRMWDEKNHPCFARWTWPAWWRAHCLRSVGSVWIA